MKDSLIHLDSLTKVYTRGNEQIFAVNNISMDIFAGEFILVAGPSGSGKTTLLNLISCLDSPTSGKLWISGQEVSGLKEKKLIIIRRKNLGFIFQSFFLLPTLTVKENVELPLLFRKEKIDNAKTRDILKLVGLSERIDHLPGELSGGEMQRVAIARALINQPRIILADEPTGNLDSVNAQKIFCLFQELNQRGLTVIVVTHNLEFSCFADRAVYLRDGKIEKIIDEGQRKP